MSKTIEKETAFPGRRFFVCYACSLSIGLKSRTSVFRREPLVEGKGVYREVKSERSLKQKLVLTNRNCILRLTESVMWQ